MDWIALTTVFAYRAAYHQRDAQVVGYERDWMHHNAKTPLTRVMPAAAGGFLAAAERCGSSVDSGAEPVGAGGSSRSDVGSGDGGGGGMCHHAGDKCASSSGLCASGPFCAQIGDGP